MASAAMTTGTPGVPSQGQAVGWAIEVYWPQEQDWFTGEIVDHQDGKFKVLYDDGDVIWEEEDSSLIRYLNKNTIVPQSEEESSTTTTICLSPKATYAPCDFDEDEEDEEVVTENEIPMSEMMMVAPPSDDEEEEEELDVLKEEVQLDPSSSAMMMMVPEDEDDTSEVGSDVDIQHSPASEQTSKEEIGAANPVIHSKWESPEKGSTSPELLIFPPVEEDPTSVKEAEEREPMMPDAFPFAQPASPELQTVFPVKEHHTSVNKAEERESMMPDTFPFVQPFVPHGSEMPLVQPFVPHDSETISRPRTTKKDRESLKQERHQPQWRIGKGDGQVFGQIIAASNLPLLSDNSDTFVTVSLVAAAPRNSRGTLFRRKTTVYQTQIQSQTRDPNWQLHDEFDHGTFETPISPVCDAQGRPEWHHTCGDVLLSVYDHHGGARKEFVGQCTINVQDLLDTDTGRLHGGLQKGTSQWYALTTRDGQELMSYLHCSLQLLLPDATVIQDLNHHYPSENPHPHRKHLSQERPSTAGHNSASVRPQSSPPKPRHARVSRPLTGKSKESRFHQAESTMRLSKNSAITRAKLKAIRQDEISYENALIRSRLLAFSSTSSPSSRIRAVERSKKRSLRKSDLAERKRYAQQAQALEHVRAMEKDLALLSHNVVMLKAKTGRVERANQKTALALRQCARGLAETTSVQLVRESPQIDEAAEAPKVSKLMIEQLASLESDQAHLVREKDHWTEKLVALKQRESPADVSDSASATLAEQQELEQLQQEIKGLKHQQALRSQRNSRPLGAVVQARVQKWTDKCTRKQAKINQCQIERQVYEQRYAQMQHRWSSIHTLEQQLVALQHVLLVRDLK